MSWASRRRFLYLSGIVLFFLLVFGLPIAYKIATIPSTCHDGKQDQGETAIDEGGPCLKLDPRTLQPHAILWARSFEVRPGYYNAVAYIENPNKSAGVPLAHYEFSLYDSSNILVAQQSGTTYIMPGGVTPVFLSGISTGNRVVVHTYFTLTDSMLNWEWMQSQTGPISVSQVQTSNINAQPQVAAIAANSSVSDIAHVSFAAVPFDTAGNAINASQTLVSDLPANSQVTIGFTWPQPFTVAVGRVDVIPLMPPVPNPQAEQ